ncbi:hypothetical protein PCANC_25610 [Puccinia coronata f. sp. avenae]|uniref:BED-type domain-containing protein n=1 Tax=Puccinia coronata f. sp. avenae TaxID=200324 RepID=A0A2N5S291_9BASI|nr:hypothetical protein PCANC_25610 [Puccinia coronata f. sp. avenae]
MAKVVKTHAQKKKVTVHNSKSESKAPDGHSKDENRSESESKQDPAVNVMDLTQDSNADNAKAIKKTSKKAQGTSVSEFDNVGLYFHPPVRGKGKTEGPKLYYKCQWCSNIYKKGQHTQSNLVKHCDGAVGCSACLAREDAILAGAKLPMTLREMEAEKKKKESGFMSKYLEKLTFNNQMLNQILVMWLIQSSLPWTWIQDLLLLISFNYACRGVRLFSRTWAATEAHRLYVNLQEKVILALKVELFISLYSKRYITIQADIDYNHQNLNSKITFIHDVWTTKGNRHAFLGIADAYISNNWVFHICHLGIKYISWTHKAQTTDSGSNNCTMTAEVDQIIYKKTEVKLNLSQNHICCFCHKIALILKAGLNVIDLASKGLTKVKQSTLGFAPGLETISEECEIEDAATVSKDNNDFNPDVDEDGAEFDADNTNSHDNSDVEAPEEMQGNIISKTLKKVNFVIQKIMSSTAKRSKFAFWSKKLNYKGPTLIAGYGICWNVKWQSQDQAYQACNIIAQLIENERDQQERKGGKNSFQDFEITRSDWDIVKRLNDILSEFYYITKQMEGDHSSAGLMIAEYKSIINFLKDWHAAKVDPKQQCFTQPIATLVHYITLRYPGNFSNVIAQVETLLRYRYL